jgi:alpha-glucosidase
MVFIYNGEEIGMRNVDIPADRVQDPAARNDPAKGMGRDPSRTPMQWTSGPMAGFTTGPDTWLPLAPDYKEHNVEIQSSDPGSFLSLYRQLGALRNGSDALRHGSLEVLDIETSDVLGYMRAYKGERLLVLINFSAEPAEVGLASLLGTDVDTDRAECIMWSSAGDAPALKDDVLLMQPSQAAVYRI